MNKTKNRRFFSDGGAGSSARRCTTLASVLFGLSTSPAHADLSQLEFSNALEAKAATAVQATYNSLLGACTDTQQTASTTCSGSTFNVWKNVRELVHTANELTGQSGSTAFSLGLNQEQLGFALRWNAAEEYSSQGSMSGGFIGSQLNGVSTRIAALRYGATGFSFNGMDDEDVLVAQRAYANRMSGGGASADQGYTWSSWGGFLNGSYTKGNKDATVYEDAFDADGKDINGGVDYRFDNHWVAGLVFGFQRQKLVFDSEKSITQGDVKMDGFSITPFALYQSDTWYFSGSLGYQRMQFDTTRHIQYPSLNPQVASVDTTAESSNDANALTASLTSGYSLPLNASFSLEPYLTADYRHIRIDGFTEKDLLNDGFNFVVGTQTINSLELTPALKLRYIIASRVGVFVPYLDIQLHNQLDDGSHSIDATYEGAEQSVSAASTFVIPTDKLDKSYEIYTVGFSTVLRGARQTTADSAASGGIQAFVNYRTIQSLNNYHQYTVSAGLRYEF